MSPQDAAVLVVNAGSSSTKAAVISGDGSTVLAKAELPQIGKGGEQRLARFISDASPCQAVAHRVVHGGALLHKPTLITDEVRAALAQASELAPLHNGPALELIDLVRQHLPSTPAVACFDTDFFASLPPAAFTYAVPLRWRTQMGVRRYGFHGLSHAWATRQGARLARRPLGELRTVCAHLGSGASLAAVVDGDAVDTTMGLTPLDGLVMSTRSGSVDPGALVHVMRVTGMLPDQLESALEHDSGLLGLGGSSDMRDVLRGVEAGEDLATLAWSVYIHRLTSCLGAMVASAGGLDLLVFTGGAGEASGPLRREACLRLRYLGVELDGERNAAEGEGDRVISSPSSSAVVAVVHAREDLEMARLTRDLLRLGSQGGAGP